MQNTGADRPQRDARQQFADHDRKPPPAGDGQNRAEDAGQADQRQQPEAHRRSGSAVPRAVSAANRHGMSVFSSVW